MNGVTTSFRPRATIMNHITRSFTVGMLLLFVSSHAHAADGPTIPVDRTGERWPENDLKFYIHFSAPMSRGDSYKRIKLPDEKGKALDMPFLELDQDLWDSAAQRLTVFCDPGRIKRGLKPREEFGPV